MKLFWLVLAMMISSVFAGPVPVGTKSEVQKAKGLIDDLVESGAGAEKLVSMAAETGKGPERFWLYSNAFVLQAKEGKYAEATETLKALQQNVTDIPEVNIINLIERNVGKKVAEAPELAAILRESKARLLAQKLVTKFKQDIQSNPKDPTLKVKLGEALAANGDWSAALRTFAKANGEASDIAKTELDMELTTKVAAFWWDYKPCSELVSCNVYKAHAVEIYSALLNGGSLSVVEKALAEGRVRSFLEAEAKSFDTGRYESKMVLLVPSADEGQTEWRYQLTNPGDGWQKPWFNDSKWLIGKNGFDSGSWKNKGTHWGSRELYLRKVVDCEFDKSDIVSAKLRFTVDDTMDVWINGNLAFSQLHFVKRHRYLDVPLDAIAKNLKKGKNVVAVKATDNGKGHYVDLGIWVEVKK